VVENSNQKNLDEALVKDCASGVVAHLEPVVGHLQAHHPQYGACTRSHWVSLLAQFFVVITQDFLTYCTPSCQLGKGFSIIIRYKSCM
jgi:hypothetical protein